MKLFYDIDLPDLGGGATASPSGITPLTSEVTPITAPAPTTARPLPIASHLLEKPPINPNLIPRPNWNDPASRSKFLTNIAGKYGNLEGRGDTIMKLNEVPRGGSDTMKNIAIKAASKYGIDPALLHASAMEEGASGLFKDLSGKDTKGRKPGEFGYQDDFGDKEYPINGSNSFGLNTFSERFPDLVKKGYLTKDFEKTFRGNANEGHFNRDDFKTPEAAMQAKAAMMKYHYDDTDSYAKARGIKLSPKARDFFAMAEYNGGEGLGHSMMNDYHNNGYLENDKFLEKRPTTGRGLKGTSYGPVMIDGKEVNEGAYAHVARRIKMQNILKEQEFFKDK